MGYYSDVISSSGSPKGGLLKVAPDGKNKGVKICVIGSDFKGRDLLHDREKDLKIILHSMGMPKTLNESTLKPVAVDRIKDLIRVKHFKFI